MNTLVSLLLAFLMTLLGVSPPKATGAHWMRIPVNFEEGMYCLAANEDETRFLITKSAGRDKVGYDIPMIVHDTVTGEQTPLFLSRHGAWEAVTDTVQMKLDETNNAAMLEQYGGIDAVAMRYMWLSFPTARATRGDLLLLANGNGFALVNMRTGETTALECRSASITGDGRLLLGDWEGVSLLDPSTGEVTPAPVSLETAFEQEATPCAAQLLSDGAVLTDLVFTQQNRVQNKMMRHMALAFFGADGALEETIDIGDIQLGQEPDQLYYSEQAGAGIAFCYRVIVSRYMYIFRRGYETAKILHLDSVDAPFAEELDPAAAADALGDLVTPSECALLPYGISRDGGSILCADLKSGYILEISLDTLAVRVVMTSDETNALVQEEFPNYQPYGVYTNLYWAGGNLLTSRSCPPGYALFIPLFP